MSFITALTHHLSSSHPPHFIPPPSHPHHSALLLSILHSFPGCLSYLPTLVPLSLFVLSPWLHLSSGSLIFSFWPWWISLPCLRVVCIHPPNTHMLFFPLSAAQASSVHLWISIHVSNLGDSTDTSTPLTSPSNAADQCWCQFAARSSRAAKAKQSGVKGHRRHSQSGQWGWKVSEGLSPGLREESGFITDESQEVKDDDITWEAEEGEGEPGRVRITDER